MSESMLDKTTMRRIEQYRDRWSSYDAHTGLVEISDMLSPEELRKYDLFQDYDDRFLEKISPDVTVATWEAGSVLFEEGSYIDLAFVVLSGVVEVFVAATAEAGQPIFDALRTGSFAIPDLTSAPSGDSSSTR